MNRYEIARSISGASSSISKLKSASSSFEKGKNQTNTASIKNESNYKGASSGIIKRELSKYIKAIQNNEDTVGQKKTAIQSRISQLEYLDRQLAEQERQQQERERQRQADAQRLVEARIYAQSSKK